MNTILSKLFSLPVCSAPDTVECWWPWLLTQWGATPSLIERAIIGGALADRVGFAFSAGYQCALRALFSTIPEGELAALCATESGGAHPKAIQSSLTKTAEGYTLNGQKTFVTLASHASCLLIVASEGQNLAVVQVSSKADGVTISQMPEFPFVPEIPHAEATFTDVQLTKSQRLPGDGYEQYLKPFRTIEDVYVHLALGGHLIGVAMKNKWPQSAIEDILSVLSSLVPLASIAPLAPETHITLSGIIRSSRRTIQDLEPNWALCPTQEQERWQRDKRLLQVAERVRQMRTESAWKKMLLTKL